MGLGFRAFASWGVLGVCLVVGVAVLVDLGIIHIRCLFNAAVFRIHRPVALEGVRAVRNPVLYDVVVFAGLGCLLVGYVPLEQFILRVCACVCVGVFVCLLACFEPEITLGTSKGTLKL